MLFQSNLVKEYINFQKLSPSPFHVVEHLSKLYQSEGFTELDLGSEWSFGKNELFYAIHPEGKSIIAFRLAKLAPSKTGFALIGAHTDSPTLRLKSRPFSNIDDYSMIQTQVHGGLINRSWIDRPLILAGRVYNYSKNKKNFNGGVSKVQSKLVKTNFPVAIIPDLAIHLDREKNTKGSINPENLLTALVGSSDKKDGIEKLQAAFKTDNFDSFELSLSPYWPHEILGLNKEYIAGPRHDDLAMVFTAFKAFQQSLKEELKKTSVVAFFDSEETGSESAGGASSYFLLDVLSRIDKHHKKSTTTSDFGQSLANSISLSADMVHGVHPSYPNKHDRNHRPLMNQGPVIKENANDRYATSGLGSAIFKAICHDAKIPTQDFVIHQDLSCGSTIGPIIAAKLGCITIDIGAAMLGMHSTCETMGCKDLEYMTKAFRSFFKVS